MPQTSVKAVLSLPAEELRSAQLPGSVFEGRALLEIPVSQALRRAYMLLAQHHPEPLCLVRPEIFVCERAQKWLRARLPSRYQHVCLSDGTSVKLLPDCENHVFFYASGRLRAQRALERLLGWVPELFGQLRSQINSSYEFPRHVSGKAPAPQLLLPKAVIPNGSPEFYPLVALPQAPDRAARHILELGPMSLPDVGTFERLTYIPLTDSSAAQPGFAALVGRAVAEAYVHPESGVILRLPDQGAGVQDLREQILRMMDTLHASGISLPRVSVQNVLLASGDIPDRLLASHPRLELLMAEGFEFWRHSRAFYKSLSTLRFQAHDESLQASGMVKILSQLMGRLPGHCTSDPRDRCTVWAWTDNATGRRRSR